MVLDLGNHAVWTQNKVLEEHIANLFEGLTLLHVAAQTSLVLVQKGSGALDVPIWLWNLDAGELT